MEIKDKSNDKAYFTIIPNYIANHSSANDQALYFQMKKVVGDREGICYASEKYFKDKLKIGSKALKKSIQYLLDHKWIEEAGYRDVETKGGIQKSNVYLVRDIWKMNIDYYINKGVSEREPLDNKGVSESNQRGVQKETKGVAFEQQRRTNNKNYNKIAKISFLRGNQWNELIDLFGNVNPLYREFYKNKTERNALDLVSEKIGFEKTKQIIEFLPKSNTIKFVPKITKPTELKRDLAKLLAWASEKKQSKQGKIISFKK